MHEDQRPQPSHRRRCGNHPLLRKGGPAARARARGERLSQLRRSAPGAPGLRAPLPRPGHAAGRRETAARFRGRSARRARRYRCPDCRTVAAGARSPQELAGDGAATDCIARQLRCRPRDARMRHPARTGGRRAWRGLRMSRGGSGAMNLPRGVWASLLAALLFGAGTPLAKLLLAQAGPWLLAALLYLGSGIGLALMRRMQAKPPVRMVAGEVKWLGSAVRAGGVAGPVLLMLGLAAMPASSASLLLNAEAVFTALLAWFVFKENVNPRVAMGMCAIVAGGLVLAWPGNMSWPGWQPALFVVAACFAWGLDNNLTRKVSLGDASWIAMVKGLVAGTTNLALAFALGTSWPALPVVLAAGLVGFASYSASLALFIVGLRELGTSRTGGYFSVAPFFGALLAIALLGEPITGVLLIDGVLMAL